MGNATFYQIKETLTPCSAEEIFSRKPGDPPYVVIMDPETWNNTKEKFDMVIDMDMDPSEVLETKAIVNFDSLTGTLYVPRRTEMGGPPHRCAFALDEKGESSRSSSYRRSAGARDGSFRLWRGFCTTFWKLSSRETFACSWIQSMSWG